MAKGKTAAVHDEEFERIYRLRSSFNLNQVESNIEYFRSRLETPIPGENGYKRSKHVEALRHAIEQAKRVKTNDALRPHRHLGGEHATPLGRTEIAECEARFDATVRQLCARDPMISEAYLGSARMRSQLHLVHSRD